MLGDERWTCRVVGRCVWREWLPGAGPRRGVRALGGRHGRTRRREPRLTPPRPAGRITPRCPRCWPRRPWRPRPALRGGPSRPRVRPGPSRPGAPSCGSPRRRGRACSRAERRTLPRLVARMSWTRGLWSGKVRSTPSPWTMRRTTIVLRASRPWMARTSLRRSGYALVALTDQVIDLDVVTDVQAGRLSSGLPSSPSSSWMMFMAWGDAPGRRSGAVAEARRARPRREHRFHGARDHLARQREPFGSVVVGARRVAAVGSSPRACSRGSVRAARGPAGPARCASRSLPPGLDAAVIAAEQHLRDLLAAEDSRAREVGVVEAARGAPLKESSAAERASPSVPGGVAPRPSVTSAGSSPPAST